MNAEISVDTLDLLVLLMEKMELKLTKTCEENWKRRKLLESINDVHGISLKQLISRNKYIERNDRIREV
jgi:hypothetical protein